MADFSQKNRKKCKKIFHIFITYWSTNGCEKRGNDSQSTGIPVE